MIQALINFYGVNTILLECCLRPIGVLFVIFGIPLVCQNKAKESRVKGQVIVGAILIGFGALLLTY